MVDCEPTLPGARLPRSQDNPPLRRQRVSEEFPAQGSRNAEPWTAPMAPVPGMLGTPAADASAPLDRLLAAFETHIQAETDTLLAYRKLAETTPDPLVALLMQLVLEDEERHHQLVERMSARLRDSLEWTRSPNALPSPAESGAPATAEALTAVRGFLRHEQEGTRHLRQLAKQSSDLYDGVFELLLNVMAMDSEKHARILEFVQRRLAQQQA